MDEAQHEYDRFGPWAIEVTADDPPPRLFRPHLTRPDAALLSIKIPRHIERRNAQPGMDLYDYLICFYEEDVTVLRRVDHEVRAETFRYQDVKHLYVEQNLLRGRLQLGLPGRSFELPYNTVSDDLMRRGVSLVRQRYAGSRAATLPVPELELGKGVLSFYFDGLLEDEQRRSSGMRLVAAQPTQAVADSRLHPIRRLLFSIASKRLLESMHQSDGHELKVVDRGGAYAYRWQAVYGVRTWFIPIVNLREAAWREDAGHATTVLELRTAGGTVEQVFSQDNPTIDACAAYLAALRAASTPLAPAPAGAPAPVPPPARAKPDGA